MITNLLQNIFAIKNTVRLDLNILLPILGLVVLGILIIMSASGEYSQEYYGSAYYFTIKQIIIMAIGFIGLLFGCLVPLKFWQERATLIFLINLLLLLAIFIPQLGKEINSGTRWINLGFIGFQPSEMLKFSLPLFYAAYIAHGRMNNQDNMQGLVIPVMAIITVNILLLLQPDFASLVVYSIVAFSILFFAGLGWKYTAFLIIGGLSAIFLLISTQPYRLQRLLCMEDLSIWKYFHDQCYQVGHSLVAIERGGIWGLGLGSGIQKYFYLPEAHTDFVFAILVEELGMICGILLIILFLFISLRITLLGIDSLQNDNYFAAYFVMGIAVLWGFQAMLNIGVSLAYFPVTGLPLPFISYGGSSLTINLFLTGIIMRVFSETRSSKRLKEYETR